MTLRGPLALAFAALLALPIALPEAAAAPNCAPREETVAVGGTFVFTDGFLVEWWSNSNGHLGLQRWSGTCADGTAYAADSLNFRMCLSRLYGFCIL